MTHGNHITQDECERMRDLRDRGYWYAAIAEELDCSRQAVDYHVNGRCSHE